MTGTEDYDSLKYVDSNDIDTACCLTRDEPTAPQGYHLVNIIPSVHPTQFMNNIIRSSISYSGLTQ